ncbi:hypothetical protein FISHEDRAFT_60031 [Fistulina hepatica ATCC 64428]|uniref:Uncharacterized protein n=1 Tax=Fistulina hepatica ATCC 64428 TaxID=1128425 RepID=A0A0D7A7A3_9AGAR|nr:hypothetical protein FISHEDRAFT_60031 [Fistulina hepatica ATCC 64428]
MDNVDGTADTSSAHLGVSWEVVMIIVLIVVVIAVVFAAIFQRRRRQRRRSRDVEQQARGGALAMPSSSDPEKRGIDIDDAAVDLIRTVWVLERSTDIVDPAGLASERGGARSAPKTCDFQPCVTADLNVPMARLPVAVPRLKAALSTHTTPGTSTFTHTPL